MMTQLTSVLSRILFMGSFLLAGLAVWEKGANLMGLTLLRGTFRPFRLLEISVVALLFVIALQLREVKLALGTKGSS